MSHSIDFLVLSRQRKCCTANVWEAFSMFWETLPAIWKLVEASQLELKFLQMLPPRLRPLVPVGQLAPGLKIVPKKKQLYAALVRLSNASGFVKTRICEFVHILWSGCIVCRRREAKRGYIIGHHAAKVGALIFRDAHVLLHGLKGRGFIVWKCGTTYVQTLCARTYELQTQELQLPKKTLSSVLCSLFVFVLKGFSFSCSQTFPAPFWFRDGLMKVCLTWHQLASSTFQLIPVRETYRGQSGLMSGTGNPFEVKTARLGFRSQNR